MRPFRLLLAGLLVAPLAFVGAARAQHPALTNPREAPGIIAAATAAGDSAALASLYAGDALLLTPQGQTLTGRAAIQAAFARNHAAGPNRISFADVRTDGDDQRAVMLMLWDLRIEPKDQPPVNLRGRSMLYFKKIAAGWVIVADMYQNLPPAPTPR